jgi:hypothetical protein
MICGNVHQLKFYLSLPTADSVMTDSKGPQKPTVFDEKSPTDRESTVVAPPRDKFAIPTIRTGRKKWADGNKLNIKHVISLTTV